MDGSKLNLEHVEHQKKYVKDTYYKLPRENTFLQEVHNVIQKRTIQSNTILFWIMHMAILHYDRNRVPKREPRPVSPVVGIFPQSGDF